jgi:hypothetical protein
VVDRNGKYSMNIQLRKLLTEKYAFEKQFEAFRATHPKYQGVWHDYWPPELLHASPERISAWIGETIVKDYGLTDPQVIALAGARISEIARGGPIVHEVDEAVRLYVDPARARPGRLELPVALDFLRLIRAAEDQNVTKVPTLTELRQNLNQLLLVEKGRDRFNLLIGKVIDRAQKTPEGRAELLRIFRDPEVNRLMNMLGGWSLSLNRRLDWERILQARPK